MSQETLCNLNMFSMRQFLRRLEHLATDDYQQLHFENAPFIGIEIVKDLFDIEVTFDCVLTKWIKYTYYSKSRVCKPKRPQRRKGIEGDKQRLNLRLGPGTAPMMNLVNKTETEVDGKVVKETAEPTVTVGAHGILGAEPRTTGTLRKRMKRIELSKVYDLDTAVNTVDNYIIKQKINLPLNCCLLILNRMTSKLERMERRQKREKCLHQQQASTTPSNVCQDSLHSYSPNSTLICTSPVKSTPGSQSASNDPYATTLYHGHEICSPVSQSGPSALLLSRSPPTPPPLNVSKFVRRSTRLAGLTQLNRPNVINLFENVIGNNPKLKILRCKNYLLCDTNKHVLLQLLELLKHNAVVQALYIHNFELGFDDEVLNALIECLKVNHNIWALNVGENFKVTEEGWERFAEQLKHTHVTHLYAGSESTVQGDLKKEMRKAIRQNRKKHMNHIDNMNLDVILNIGQMWWNPKNSRHVRRSELKFA